MHCNAARCRVLFVLQTEEGVYSVLCFKSYVNIVNWCQSCRRALVPQAVRWHGRVTNQRVLDCVGLFRHHPPCSSSPTVQRQYATRCEAGRWRTNGSQGRTWASKLQSSARGSTVSIQPNTITYHSFSAFGSSFSLSSKCSALDYWHVKDWGKWRRRTIVGK